MARLFSLLLCGLLAWPGLAAADEIILYAYHLKPPYIVDRDKQTGLYFDLAAYLNERVSAHSFKTVYLPRRRLEHDLETGRLNGLVVGVHPAWFKDESRTRYLWSPPFVHDEDVVVSNSGSPLPYAGPESLVGKSVGLSMGYYYFGIDELVRAGRIKRDEAISEEVSLDKLRLKRIDATVVTRRTYDYLLRHRPEWRKEFFVSKKPHDEFDRLILVPKEYGFVMQDLNAALGPILHDPQWQKILRSYY
ncbi:ABC transporter substrate-binding protein [Massilia sp. TS11]|uniref:substrate-binding periplasmic protein n=1 Tax=Massilia sp. TS11 TaxID=2908003 RepID=UPI001EDAC844|nr:transporter substrate-binding domain-containing protein [Massilia sp. TS11]MCG2585051.1 transporter substrate-binding domain-containing protein [Massilia sp. TS11]